MAQPTFFLFAFTKKSRASSVVTNMLCDLSYTMIQLFSLGRPSIGALTGDPMTTTALFVTLSFAVLDARAVFKMGRLRTVEQEGPRSRRVVRLARLVQLLVLLVGGALLIQYAGRDRGECGEYWESVTLRTGGIECLIAGVDMYNPPCDCRAVRIETGRMHQCGGPDDLRGILGPYWGRFHRLAFWGMGSGDGFDCVLHADDVIQIGDLRELRTMFIHGIAQPAAPSSWVGLTALVHLHVEAADWLRLSAEPFSSMRMLESFRCDACWRMVELDQEVLSLPRLQSVVLLGAQMCDQSISWETPGSVEFVCAGLSPRSCSSVPEWFVATLQFTARVTTTVCASACEEALVTLRRYDKLPHDGVWNSKEISMTLDQGRDGRYQMMLTPEGLQCAQSAAGYGNASVLSVPAFMQWQTSVSTCRRCPWFEEQITFHNEATDLSVPPACDRAGYDEGFWSACSVDSPATDCPGWCGLMAKVFHTADSDGSGGLNPAEYDEYAKSGGIPSEGGDAHQCLAEMGECVVDGEVPYHMAALIAAHGFGFAPTTCLCAADVGER
uniref:EF-hand domain-containing protein n=1 Tax=Oxyrrhis marina TaxID=2969 RepID=A0A7S4GQC5_OXYMA